MEAERQAAEARRSEEERRRKEREEEEEKRRDAEIRNRAKSIAQLRKAENVVAKQQAPPKAQVDKQWVRFWPFLWFFSLMLLLFL